MRIATVRFSARLQICILQKVWLSACTKHAVKTSQIFMIPSAQPFQVSYGQMMIVVLLVFQLSHTRHTLCKSRDFDYSFNTISTLLEVA
jgi:hypothetical protein